MDFLNFIYKECIIFIPVLWIVGYIFKHMNIIANKYIPMMLMLLGILLSFSYFGIKPMAFVQGVLVAGASIGLHQVKKQIKKGE